MNNDRRSFAVRLACARASVDAAEAVKLPSDHPYADQVRAANRDTFAKMIRMARGMDLSAVVTGPFPADQRAHILAALMRCDCCPHIHDRGITGDLPTMAVLTADWIGCERCVAARLADGANEPFPPNGTPGRETCCDYCDADDGTDVFTPVILQTGALVVSGHACDACVVALS